MGAERSNVLWFGIIFPEGFGLLRSVHWVWADNRRTNFDLTLDNKGNYWHNVRENTLPVSTIFAAPPMELIDTEKEDAESSGLRLVADNKEPQALPLIETQFVNFMFFRVSPDWRKLNSETKAISKSEFEHVFAEFEDDLLLFCYSLVGFDSKADLMFWRVGTSLDSIQDMTARLYRTKLGSYLEPTDNYLSITRKMMFVRPESKSMAEDRYHVVAGQKRYHFLYPCSKQSEWFEKSEEEREVLIKENFMVGKKFQNIKIHMTHAFGFSDQEYLISFETDEPKDFLALAEELRQTAASKFTLRGMPIYTCRLKSLSECLRSLG